MRFPIHRAIIPAIALSIAVECAKILAIFPARGPSQYIAVERYLKTLAARDHELTVISQFPQKTAVPNFKDITLVSKNFESGADQVNMDMSTTMNLFQVLAKDKTLLVLENTEVQKLLNTTSAQFDLIILETEHVEALYAFGPHFNAHLIGFSAYGSDETIDPLTGNISPISYVPQIFSGFTDRMNFWERLENIRINLMFWYKLTYKNLRWQRQVYKKYFPHLKHDLDDIRRNFSLILLNNHFVFSFPRPYVPNMIEVGGLYIKDEPSKLPTEMADFIENAKDGAIYFSLGSNVKTKFLPPKTLDIILKVFGSLKQRVLFKFECSELPNKPPNVFINNWFPQTDILAHPNVKLFITHAGLLSTMEAIYYAKPIIGFPMYFDHFVAAAHAEYTGFGITMDYKNLTEESLKSAILEVLENDSFRQAAEIRSRIFHDLPMKPLDRAIYWTEYVLRHNGASHMRVAALELSFWQYYSLDTMGFIFGAWFLAVICLAGIVYYLIKGLYCWTNKPMKKNKYL